MENNKISHSTKVFNTDTISNMLKTLSNGFCKHFCKIILASVAFGAIIYTLKMSNTLAKIKSLIFESSGKEEVEKTDPKKSNEIKSLILESSGKEEVEKTDPKGNCIFNDFDESPNNTGEDKVENKAKETIDSNEILDEEKSLDEEDEFFDAKDHISKKKKPKRSNEERIEYIYSKAKCNPKDIIKLSPKDFEDLSKEIKKSSPFAYPTLMQNLNKSSKKDNDGNVYFTSPQGFENLSKILAACTPACQSDPYFHGKWTSNLYYIDPSNELFKKMNGKIGRPAPKLTNGGIIVSSTDFADFIKEQAKAFYKERATVGFVEKVYFNEFQNSVAESRNYFTEEIKKSPEKYKNIDNSDFEHTLLGEIESRIYIAYKSDSPIYDVLDYLEEL